MNEEEIHINDRQNLKTLAKKLDISTSTVSRAFSGKKGVSHKKRKEILALAEELGIQPDPSASMLRMGKRRGLCIVIPHEATEISAIRNNLLFAKGVENLGSCSVFVSVRGEDINEVLKTVIGRNYEAIVLCGTGGKIDEKTVTMIRTQKIAFLSIDTNHQGIDKIVFRRENGTYQATRLFLLGERKNIHVLSFTGIEKPDSRLNGVLAAFSSLNVPIHRLKLIQINGGTSDTGYQITKRIIAESPVEAMLCTNDMIALGALKALHDSNINVPRDVWVVGFDNLAYTQYLTIPLTTVSQPMEEAATAAIRMLLARIKDYNQPPMQESFSCHLLVRESAPITDYQMRKAVFQEYPYFA